MMRLGVLVILASSLLPVPGPSPTPQRRAESLGGSPVFYEGGHVAALGTRSRYENDEFVWAEERGTPLPRWKEFLRLGTWEFRYPGPQIRTKAKVAFDVGWYTQCCAGGPCEWPYEFRVGDFEAWWPNGNRLAKGVFIVEWKTIDTNCEGGDTIKKGVLSPDTQYWTENGEPADRSVLAIAGIDPDDL